jgi:hypothetical protein
MMKYGRNLAAAPHKMLSLSPYLTGASPPAVVGMPNRPDWAAGAWSGLAEIDGNDQYGDCCFAGIMHLLCILIAQTGMKVPFPTRDQALALYTAVTGFNPNDPNTDVGGDLPTVLAWVKLHGALPDGSFKCAGSVSVDASNPVELKTAIWLFGGLYMGLFLPDGWTQNEPQASGFRWDVVDAPDMNQGHCIIAYGANDDGVFVDSWGLEGIVTYAAMAKYFTASGNGECHAVLWPNWIDAATQQAPNGLDYAALQADLARLP